MGAAEDDGVYALLQHGFEGAADGDCGLGAAQVAPLDRLDETLGRDGDHVHAGGGGEAAYHVGQQLPAHGDVGGEDAYAPSMGCGHGGLDGGHQAHDGRAVPRPQVLQASSRSRVAGHHDSLGALPQQELPDL